MAHLILPIAAFLGAVLVLIPVPSHWRARNYATVSLVAWLFVLDIIYGVNSIVWNDNVKIKLLVWCDITTKLTIGASVALPAAAMCICKHLELVASGRVVRVSHGDKQLRMYFDLAMCYLLPAIIMALHYIVQGHRFDIVEAFGCQPATYYSIPGVFIVWLPPLLLAVISMVYAGLALYHFLRHRVTFATILQNSNSSITPNRYLRLMALAVTEIIWQITLTVLPMYDNISAGLRPWTTWADVHSDWLRVDPYPLDVFVPAYRRQLFLLFFAIPASSLLFFIFFGFGEQAVRDYHQTFDWIRRKVLRQKPKAQTKGMILCSSGSVSSPSAYTVPRFASDDGNSLPAYSPPSNCIAFQSPSKAEDKKDMDDHYCSNASMHEIAIATLNLSDLSPTEDASSVFSHFAREQEASTTSGGHPITLPTVPNQHALVSPTSPPRAGLPIPPRPRVHISHFSTDSDIADMA